MRGLIKSIVTLLANEAKGEILALYSLQHEMFRFEDVAESINVQYLN